MEFVNLQGHRQYDNYYESVHGDLRINQYITSVRQLLQTIIIIYDTYYDLGIVRSHSNIGTWLMIDSY